MVQLSSLVVGAAIFGTAIVEAATGPAHASVVKRMTKERRDAHYTIQATAAWFEAPKSMGACGNVSTDDEKVIGLPHALLASDKKKPFCGLSVEVTMPDSGKKQRLNILEQSDNDYAILSKSAFQEFAPLDVGLVNISIPVPKAFVQPIQQISNDFASLGQAAEAQVSQATASFAAEQSALFDEFKSEASRAGAFVTGVGAQITSGIANAISSNDARQSAILDGATRSLDFQLNKASQKYAQQANPEVTWLIKAPEATSAHPINNALHNANKVQATASPNKAKEEKAAKASASQASEKAAETKAAASKAAASQAAQSQAAQSQAAASKAAASKSAAASQAAASKASEQKQEKQKTQDKSSGSSGNSIADVIKGGFATFYEQKGVTGACGQVHSDSDFICALETKMYDGGKNCGRKIQLTRTDTNQSVVATVADECPTCTNTASVDLSHAAFQKLASYNLGMFEMTWKFI